MFSKIAIRNGNMKHSLESGKGNAQMVSIRNRLTYVHPGSSDANEEAVTQTGSGLQEKDLFRAQDSVKRRKKRSILSSGVSLWYKPRAAILSDLPEYPSSLKSKSEQEALESSPEKNWPGTNIKLNNTKNYRIKKVSSGSCIEPS